MNTASYAVLKPRQNVRRWQAAPSLALRVPRALSRRQRVEQDSADASRFMLLWIAFNAAYATDVDDQRRVSEQHTFKLFLKKLHDLDATAALEQLVWERDSSAIRLLLDNPTFFRLQGLLAWQRGLC